MKILSIPVERSRFNFKQANSGLAHKDLRLISLHWDGGIERPMEKPSTLKVTTVTQ
jgi:hypothetical protein